MSNLLYKYLDVNGATMMLYHSNLMFANATTFNDPFDCHPSLIDFSNVPPEECKGWTPKIVEDLRTNRHENYRNDLWICCLSKVYDSLLMWSYYNKHEGVCIGLNMDNVAKYIDASYGLMATARGKEVEYRDIIEKPVCRSFHGDYFDYQIFTKAKAWEHEQEVRLFVYKPSPMFFRLLPFQKDKQDFDIKEARTFIELGPECFDSIYLGVKISPENKAEIIQYAKKLNPDIKIYQMEIDPDAFRVVDRRIE